MIDQRKMIDALLLLEMMSWRLATLTESFMRTTGHALKRLLVGRSGPRLLSVRQIYGRNLFGIRKMDGSARPSSGLYIRRVGRLGSVRGLVVGQTGKDY